MNGGKVFFIAMLRFVTMNITITQQKQNYLFEEKFGFLEAKW